MRSWTKWTAIVIGFLLLILSFGAAQDPSNYQDALKDNLQRIGIGE